jgi:cell division septum initiation protein DivIVA
MDSSALASSILALRSSIKSLESCSNSLESLLYIFVALVVIGVVLEVGFVVWEYREDMKEFRRGIIHSPHRPSGRKLLLELAGAGLVAIGVAGELAIDVKSGGIQTTLRAKNGELIDILQNASGTALRVATENEKEAAQLRKDAEGLKKQAEDERSERVKIQARVAWRSLTDRQKEDIGSTLRRTFSNLRVSVWYHVGDTEGSWFAADIADALTATHTLRVFPPASVMVLRENAPAGTTIRREDTGVTLQSTNDDPSRRLAAAIIQELTTRGFDARRQTDPPFDSNPTPQVWVNVEPRPMGPQGEFKLEADHPGK